jgi:hypothetical protein
VFNNERPHEGLNNQVPASLYIPSSIRFPRKLPEFKYPKGLLLRRVNNSGDISWHKNRVFISEVFRFEELGVELITLGLYRVETWRSENSIPKSFASELREECAETIDECIGLFSSVENAWADCFREADLSGVIRLLNVSCRQLVTSPPSARLFHISPSQPALIAESEPKTICDSSGDNCGPSLNAPREMTPFAERTCPRS